MPLDREDMSDQDASQQISGRGVNSDPTARLMSGKGPSGDGPPHRPVPPIGAVCGTIEQTAWVGIEPGCYSEGFASLAIVPCAVAHRRSASWSDAKMSHRQTAWVRPR